MHLDFYCHYNREEIQLQNHPAHKDEAVFLFFKQPFLSIVNGVVCIFFHSELLRELISIRESLYE